VDRSVDAAPSEKVSSDDSQTSVDNIKTKKFPVPDKEWGFFSTFMMAFSK
jgi:hypothetical protein